MNARELLDTFEQNSNLRPDQRVLPLPDGREFYVPLLFAALRAVVDLHQPYPGVPVDSTWCMHCLDNNLGPKWPCPTVRKITAALEAK